MCPSGSDKGQLVTGLGGGLRAVLGRCSTPARQTVSAVDLSNDQCRPKLFSQLHPQERNKRPAVLGALHSKTIGAQRKPARQTSGNESLLLVGLWLGK